MRAAALLASAALASLAGSAMAQPAAGDCLLTRRMDWTQVRSVIDRCVPLGMTYDDVAGLLDRSHVSHAHSRQLSEIEAYLPAPSFFARLVFKSQILIQVRFDSEGLVVRRDVSPVNDFI